MIDILQEIERLRIEQIQLRMDLEEARGDSDDYWQQALQHIPPVYHLASPADPFEHDWQVYDAIGKSTYELRTGIWQRNAIAVQYAGTAGTPIDPVTATIIPSDYTGPLYVYSMLNDSHSPTDIKIVTSVNKFEVTGLSFQSDPFRMTTLIGVLTYVDGLITDVAQHQVGGIQDICNLGCGQFGIKVIKTAYDSFEFRVMGGDVQIRDVALYANFVSDTTEAAMYWSLDLNAYPGDPSLIPTTATIVANEGGWGAITTYQRHHYRLYITEIASIDTSTGGTKNYKFPCCMTFHKGGSIHDDWVRPDGQDETENGISTIFPRGKTVGFVPAGTAHAGELEDYNFTARVLAGTKMATNAGDAILPWYSYAVGAATIKDYLRLDSSNSGYHPDSAQSIALRTTDDWKIMEIFDFKDKTLGELNITASTDFNSALLVMARENVAGALRVRYLNLSSFKPATAGAADTAGTATYVTNSKHTELIFSNTTAAIYEGLAEAETNFDQDSAYLHKWNGLAADTKSFRTTGTQWMSGLHVSHDGATDDQYWNATSLRATVSADIGLVSGTTGSWTTADNSKMLELGTSTAKWGSIEAWSAGAIDLTAAATSTIMTTDNSKLLYLGTNANRWRNVVLYSQLIDLIASEDSSWYSTTAGKNLSLGLSGSNWNRLNLFTDDIYINGTQGATVANWFEKGIMVGTLTEVSVAELLPTDKVLVLR
jgi:hypothetical protein